MICKTCSAPLTLVFEERCDDVWAKLQSRQDFFETNPIEEKSQDSNESDYESDYDFAEQKREESTKIYFVQVWACLQGDYACHEVYEEGTYAVVINSSPSWKHNLVPLLKELKQAVFPADLANIVYDYYAANYNEPQTMSGELFPSYRWVRRFAGDYCPDSRKTECLVLEFSANPETVLTLADSGHIWIFFDFRKETFSLTFENA